MHFAMWPLFKLVMILLRCIPAFSRSRNDQAIVELALHQQLATHALNGPKPRITSVDRTFWVLLSRIWSDWKDTLVIVQPDTVVRWHRQGFRLYWRSISKRGPGRAPRSGAIATRHSTTTPNRAKRIGDSRTVFTAMSGISSAVGFGIARPGPRSGAISWPLRLAPTWGSLKVPVGPIAAASVPSGPAGKWLELVVWATRLSGGSGAKIPIFGRRLIEVCCGFFEPGRGSRRRRRRERGCSGWEAQAGEDAPCNHRLGDGGLHPHRFSALTSEGFDTEYSLE